MSKLNNELHVLSELYDINHQLMPLKDLADRELASIRGLTGMVYTPYLDDYMQVAIKKAEIVSCLKNQKLLPLSEVEVIHTALNALYSRARTRSVVEYQGRNYERRFLPLKLSKSGKNVQKWAKVWLLLDDNGRVVPAWESQVREIWPTYYLIRSIDI